jgi:hypothetical protein
MILPALDLVLASVALVVVIAILRGKRAEQGEYEGYLFV